MDVGDVSRVELLLGCRGGGGLGLENCLGLWRRLQSAQYSSILWGNCKRTQDILTKRPGQTGEPRLTYRYPGVHQLYLLGR